MKVCLLNDSFPPAIDGVANVVMNYAGIMTEEGMADILVGTPKYPGGEYHTYPYRVEPYESLDTSKLAMGYRAGNPLSVKELITLSEFQPDIIHAHSPVSALYMARLLRFQINAPLVFTYHTKFDIDIANAIKGKVIQKEALHALVRNVSACDEVWVVSKGAGENLRSIGYEGDYRVMSNGVDFEKGAASAELVKKATAGYDLPDGVPVFLFVGRIMNYKGLPLIMDALAKLSADGFDFRMVFVGKGPDETELREKAKKCLKPEQCIFTGPIYDREVLRAWDTRADLFLFPSTFDTNGLVVREAAACGLASVLIKDSCAAEGVEDGVDGFLIEENAESMYQLLKSVCGDLNHLHEVGSMAMEHLYISWRESVHTAYDRYEQIIDDFKSGKITLKHNAFSESLLQIQEDVREFQEDMRDERDRQRDKINRHFKEMQEDFKELQRDFEEIQRRIEKELKEIF